MADYIYTDVYPRGYYHLNVVNLYDRFDFVVGDFTNFSYPNLSYELPTYKIMKTVDDREVIDFIPYIDKPREYFFNEFSSVYPYRSPEDMNSNFTNSMIYIFDDTLFSLDIYDFAPNIYDYFTQSELDDFYKIKAFDYWGAYNLPFTPFEDYQSPIGLYTQHISSSMERIFFNVDVAYGRSSTQFLKIAEFFEKHLTYIFNKDFYSYVAKFYLNKVTTFQYYIGYRYVKQIIIDYDGNEVETYEPLEYRVFDFRYLYSHSIYLPDNRVTDFFNYIKFDYVNAEVAHIIGRGIINFTTEPYERLIRDEFDPESAHNYPSINFEAVVFDGQTGSFIDTKRYYRQDIFDENGSYSNWIWRDNYFTTYHIAIYKSYLLNQSKEYVISVALDDFLNPKKCCLAKCFGITE